ncbi:calcyclin-binding protein [Esox lucius]|uniref:Calcyclin-binding protein n=2 Tax=Esox lucius TaxID=8010 RepID=C1BVY9_ESOLU|nr:calcyclin-binding protein [Esox lucius]ACO13192.1 Calcyclin-binding protein [Esox lucius]
MDLLNDQINQLESDLQEISNFLEKSERQRVQDVLILEQKKIEKEISFKRQQIEQQAKRKAELTSGSKTYTVKINNYGWDQSDKFVKIYITLKGVHTIAPESVEATFTERSLVVLVKELDGKNHQMIINNLLYPIDVQNSFTKTKTDMVLVMCKKTTNKKWDCLTQVEKQTKEKDKPNLNPDENADPSDGLMSMLKKMYTEGDDDMKRTINKAWTESQEKKAKGDGDMNMF